MWEDWQEIVKRSLPNFCASPIYVQQRSQTDEDFERAAEQVARGPQIDIAGKLRDVKYGGVVRHTKACGDVTRMWIDSCVEIEFLMRNGILSSIGCYGIQALDIGAGYGRLAVPLSRYVGRITCVDSVPISTEICHKYTQEFATGVHVLSLPEFVAQRDSLGFDLAINVHSWNECSFEQVRNWLDVLREMKVPYLFTVTNGSIKSGRTAYTTWGGKGDSFRPLLEERYDLVTEEETGLSMHPHGIWRLR
jgi:SAM-dependent methyltransferase